MSAFSLSAIHRPHLLVGAAPEVRALVRIRASGLGASGADASLRLWTPNGATVAAFAEVAPTICELRRRAVRLDDRTIGCAAGRWSDGAREYELVIALPPGAAGDEILVARLEVVVDEDVVGRVPVAVTWTDDASLLASRPPEGRAPVAASPVAELPTGRSPAPRHTPAMAPAGPPCCPACDLRGNDGDRFCERCGESLVGAQKS